RSKRDWSSDVCSSDLAIGGFILFGFVLGVGCVWLYAAIRPRFGPGVGTAACAGAVVWFFAYLYPSTGMALMHMFPRRVLAVGVRSEERRGGEEGGGGG